MTQSLDADVFKKRMLLDLKRALTFKTELFARDNYMNLTVGYLTNQSYNEWLQKTRFSHALIFGLMDKLEKKSVEDLRVFTDSYLDRDTCMCLFKASKISPIRFYADFIRWTASDWVQVRLDSRQLDGYQTQIDVPSVKLKLTELAGKVLDFRDDSLNEEETLFLVKVFEELWCFPLHAAEVSWKSTCACPYERNNVDPHRHICSNCQKRETEPGILKCCGRCNQCEYGKHFKRYYCDVECQRQHWESDHKNYHRYIKDELAAEPANS